MASWLRTKTQRPTRLTASPPNGAQHAGLGPMATLRRVPSRGDVSPRVQDLSLACRTDELL